MKNKELLDSISIANQYKEIYKNDTNIVDACVKFLLFVNWCGQMAAVLDIIANPKTNCEDEKNACACYQQLLKDGQQYPKANIAHAAMAMDASSQLINKAGECGSGYASDFMSNSDSLSDFSKENTQGISPTITQTLANLLDELKKHNEKSKKVVQQQKDAVEALEVLVTMISIAEKTLGMMYAA